MSQVIIQINGRDYPVQCEPGQETHIHMLGEEINKRFATLVKSMGQIGDNRLLVMTCLFLADELTELKESASSLVVDNGQAKDKNQTSSNEVIFADALNKVAQKIETVAEKLKTV